jgi:hypothetical protein
VLLLLVTYSQLGLLGYVPALPERHHVLTGLFGAVACLVLLRVVRPAGWLAAIGAFSFTIYTCHVFGTAAARLALERVGVESVTVHMLMGLIAGVAIGVAVELAARRTRLSRTLILGQRWWQRRPAAGVA